MLPEFPRFKPFELEDLARLKDHSPAICEFCPTNLIIWRDFDKPQFTLINNNLCILITPPNEPPFFLEPLGSNQLIETVNVCLAHCQRISRASESFIAGLPLTKFHIKCLRNQFDYVYEVRTLAELKGRKFDGKRNHIKNFQRRHPDYRYLPLTSDKKNKCLELFEEWFAARHESRYFPKLAYVSQKTALAKAFKYYDQLKLLGGMLLVEDQLKGFMIGSRLDHETVAAHFQYGHPSLRGIFQTLLWEACHKTFNKFKYLNLEQDLGIPGLRKAKSSYYPDHWEKKFEITPV